VVNHFPPRGTDQLVQQIRENDDLANLGFGRVL
jgi:hypothetical protein